MRRRQTGSKPVQGVACMLYASSNRPLASSCSCVFVQSDKHTTPHHTTIYSKVTNTFGLENIFTAASISRSLASRSSTRRRMDGVSTTKGIFSRLFSTFTHTDRRAEREKENRHPVNQSITQSHLRHLFAGAVQRLQRLESLLLGHAGHAAGTLGVRQVPPPLRLHLS